MSAEIVDVPAMRAFAFVHREMGFERSDLSNRRRAAGLVRGRALFIFALRHHRVSYPRIGRALDRDHTSIINLKRIADELRRIDPDGFGQQCARYIEEADHGCHR